MKKRIVLILSLFILFFIAVPVFAGDNDLPILQESIFIVDQAPEVAILATESPPVELISSYMAVYESENFIETEIDVGSVIYRNTDFKTVTRFNHPAFIGIV